MEPTNPFNQLPQEIVHEIFSHLSLPALHIVRRVDRRFMSLSKSTPIRKLELTPIMRRNIDNIMTQLLESMAKGCEIRIMKLDGIYKLNTDMFNKLLESCKSTIESLVIKNCRQIMNVDKLAVCTKLSSLEIIDAPLAISVIPPTLRRLVLNKATITAQLASKIQACNELVYLSLEDNYNVSDALVKDAIKNCQKLQILNLSWCTEITDSSLISISTSCPQLTQLWLEECHSISDSGLKQVLSKCSHIHTLDIQQCFRVTSALISYVKDFKIPLRYLNIIGCQSITTSDKLKDYTQKNPHCEIITAVSKQKKF